MADTYLVLLDNGGTDGPYTLDELRERLRTGRVRSGDRLAHMHTRTQCQMIELIPEARDISHARPAASERIRRKISDRHAAAKAASNRSSARTPAVPVLTAPAPADYLTAANTSSTEPAANSRERPAWAKAWVGIVAAVVIVVVIWSLLPVRGGRGLSVGALAGRWHVGPDTAIMALKNAKLVISQEYLTISQGGSVRQFGITFAASDARVVVVELQPIDRDLGQFLEFKVVPTGLQLVTISGSAVLKKL